jgi:uncharacterized protein (TIGR02757 family)
MKDKLLQRDKDILDDLYRVLNRREFISPDPLQFLYDYSDLKDREIAGLVASSLAYGRVAQILRNVSRVLNVMEGPAEFVVATPIPKIKKAFLGIKHRFTTAEEIANLCIAARHAILEHGGIGELFRSCLSDDDETILPGMSRFVSKMNRYSDRDLGYLLPSPDRGSACKRLNLYLRWMVRRDAVDPGGWGGIPKSKLIVPLDAHMFSIGRRLGMTRRRQADMKTAQEITAGFRLLSPRDPVKYDFALTRLGIRGDMDMDAFFRRFLRK